MVVEEIDGVIVKQEEQIVIRIGELKANLDAVELKKIKTLLGSRFSSMN